MEDTIQEKDEVWTSDSVKLGVVHALHHRPNEIRPEDQLYGTYLEVYNFEIGDDYYVPLDFIASRDAEQRRLTLAVPMKEVMQRTWSRAPEFVAKAKSHRVSLTTHVQNEPELEPEAQVEPVHEESDPSESRVG
jgi:hypothetical protein